MRRRLLKIYQNFPYFTPYYAPKSVLSNSLSFLNFVIRLSDESGVNKLKVFIFNYQRKIQKHLWNYNLKSRCWAMLGLSTSTSCSFTDIKMKLSSEVITGNGLWTKWSKQKRDMSTALSVITSSCQPASSNQHALYLNKSESPSPRIFPTKFSWNWLYDSWEVI